MEHTYGEQTSLTRADLLSSVEQELKTPLHSLRKAKNPNRPYVKVNSNVISALKLPMSSDLYSQLDLDRELFNELNAISVQTLIQPT